MQEERSGDPPGSLNVLCPRGSRETPCTRGQKKMVTTENGALSV